MEINGDILSNGTYRFDYVISFTNACWVIVPQIDITNFGSVVVYTKNISSFIVQIYNDPYSIGLYDFIFIGY